MRQWVLVLLVVIAAPLLPSAQVGQGTITTIDGQVVADADGRPLAGVHITARPMPSGQPVSTLTDPNGRFEVTLAAAEQYQFSVQKAGFVSITTNNRDEIRLEEGAVVTGRAVDDTGEPILQATVASSEPDGTELASTRTDDRGEYRLFIRPTETFVLSITTQGAESARAIGTGQIRIETPAHVTYYPGTVESARAMQMELQPGEIRSGMDFAVPTAQSLRQPFRALESVPNFLAAETATAGGAGVIQGHVLDSSGRAVTNALVLLAMERGGSTMRMTRTDDAGNFEFRQVPAGPARVMGSKASFTADEARPVITAQQDRAAQVELRLVPWASISGRILNEFGEPIQDAQVQLMRTRYTSGRRTLVPAGNLEPESDDRGAYRIYGLEPGTYIVTAQIEEANGGDTPGYARAYYPGTPSPAAALSLQIVPGQDLTDIDIQLSRTSTFAVSGRILNAGGQPTAIPNVQLWPTLQPGTISVPLAARVNADGTFEFANVADGQYVIQVYRGRLNSTTEGDFGVLPITVSGGNVNDLVVTTMAGSIISGTIVLDTNDPSRQPSRANLELSPVPGDLDLAPASNWATAGVGPDWRFSFFGISGPRRIVPTQLPQGWAVKEVRVNGIDVGDRALPFGAASQSLSNVEVVLTNQPSDLRGSVTSASGESARDSYVVVFPPERDHWYPLSRYVRRVAVQGDGTFALAGMPPGGYYVVVTPAASGADDAWQDPLNLESLISRGSFVMLEQAQRTTVQLRAP